VRFGIVGDVGDTFEVAVDVEATLDEAPRLASTVIEWLTVEGIIDATPTDDRDLWGAGYYPARTELSARRCAPGRLLTPSGSHSRASAGSRS
jgi:uncharacterized protein (DUF2345 family)